MSSRTYLHVPVVDKFRRRAASTSEFKDRYVSSGGFVDIRELAKQYEAERVVVASQKHSLFGSSSSHARSSRASSVTDELGSPSTISLPLSPYRSEGWATPDTPQTPSTPLKSTFLSPKYQNHTIASPVSKHRRYGHDLSLTLSPDVVSAHEKLTRNLADDITPTQDSKFGVLFELPGSLLLPSQGFPQSDPPVLPPRHILPDRSQSAPACPRIEELMIALGEPFVMAKTSNHDKDLDNLADVSPSTQRTHPPRLSSLPDHVLKSPRCPPPPVPLSQMTMEELMHVLPTLNAAIVAHDWVPCVQKRHHELKNWLQKNQIDMESAEEVKVLHKGLIRLIRESEEVALTYHQLFEIVKSLQSEDAQHKANEVDEANAQKSEAIMALARQTSINNEKCASHERDMAELKDRSSQCIDTLILFIHQNIQESLPEASREQIQEFLNVFIEADSETSRPSTHVRSDIYEDLQVSLQKTTTERDDLREICDEQMYTIKQQSKDLDRYIAQIAEVIRILQDKEKQNRKLRAEISELTQIKQICQKKVDEAQIPEQNNQDTTQSDDKHEGGPPRIADQQIWSRDAEIANLRHKLGKSYMREQELQNQIRQLLQTSQIEATQKPASRLKRFLGGQSKSSASIPTLHSMQNLSYVVLPPLSKDRTCPSAPSSPAKSGRNSPSLGAFCGQTVSTTDHLELPQNRKYSPPPLPSRPRDASRCPPQDDIDSAVSSRFYQNQGQSHRMPYNMRSTASTPQHWTPSSSRQSSYDEGPEYVRQCRRRLDSDPNPPRFDPINARVDEGLFHEQVIDDHEPMIHNQQRILSGITEVTEDGSSSLKRESTNTVSDGLDSPDRRAYLDSVHAASALGQLQIL